MDIATALDPPILSMSFRAAPPPLVPLPRKRRKQRLGAGIEKAQACHEKLVQLESVRSSCLSNRVQRAIRRQGALFLLLQRSQLETRLVESFLQNILTAQKQLLNDLKVASPHQSMQLGDDDISVLTECEQHVSTSSVMSVSSTIALNIMHKSTRLMIYKVYTLGVKQLQQALDRVRRFLKVLQEHRDDLEHLEQMASIVLEETESQVLQAWDTYLNDALDWMEKEDDSPSNVAHTISSSHKSEAPVVTTNSSRNSNKNKSELVRRRSISCRNNVHLRNMNNAASSTATVRDIWLSEWSYRAHVLEQVNASRDLSGKLRQLYSAIKTQEVKRRLQLQNDLLAVTKHQQRLAINLQAASTWSLMEYMEGRNQEVIDEEENEDSDDDDDRGRANQDNATLLSPTKPRFEFGLMSSHGNGSCPKNLTLPPLMESGFVILVTVARRKEMNTALLSPVSLLVVTTDGILYFFDLPSDETFNDYNLRRISVSQAYESLLRNAAKRQLIAEQQQQQLIAEQLLQQQQDDDDDDQTEEEEAKPKMMVKPPTPSLRFIMAQCSVEMTMDDDQDCAVKFCIPESLGNDFFIELPSARMVIGFIDNFHACKFSAEDALSDDDAMDKDDDDDEDDDDEDEDEDEDISSKSGNEDDASGVGASFIDD